MTNRVSLVSVALMIGLSSTPLAAQTATTIDAGIAIAVVQAPSVSGGTPNTPVAGIGGTTQGPFFGIAGSISPKLAIGAEVTIEMPFDFVQASRTSTFRGTYREVIVSGVIRYQPVPGLQLVAGLSFVAPDLTGGGGSGTSPGGGFGGVFGAEAPLPLSPRFAVVPGLRVHVISRDTGSFLNPFNQVGSWIIQPSISLRAIF